jgi:hypothetical protein
MKTIALMTTATALLAFTAIAEARTSSGAELRGYDNCVAAAKKESNGLVAGTNYLIDKAPGSTLYYVNATRWEDGERKNVRIACETAARGHNLVSSVIEDGRFTNVDTRVTVEVAQH